MRADGSKGKRGDIRNDLAIEDLMSNAGRFIVGGAMCAAIITACAHATPSLSYAADGVDEQPDAGASSTDPEAERLIERIECADASSEHAELADGGAYRPQVRVCLSRPIVVDYEKSQAILEPSVGEDGDDETDHVIVRPVVVEGSEDQETPEVSCLEFAVPDGRYESLSFVLCDAEGNTFQSDEFANVVFDGCAPVFHVLMGGERVCDGAMLSKTGEFAIEVLEPNPQRDDEGRPLVDVQVVDVVRGEELEVGSWAYDAVTGTCVARVGEGELEDGTYEVTLRGRDIAGNCSDAETTRFSMDTRAPRVLLEIPMDESSNSLEDSAYFDHALHVRARVLDANVDKGRTLVLGTSVADLLACEGSFDGTDGSFSCEQATCKVDEDGVTSIELAITLRDGSFAVDKIVQAYDLVGHEAVSSLDIGNSGTRELVVDTVAPTVEPIVSSIPATTCDSWEQGGPVVFFDRRTTLTLRFEDEGGVDTAELEGVGPESLLALGMFGDGAGVALEDGPLSNGMRVRVRDRAGNVTWWSLEETGEKKTWEGLLQRENEPVRDMRGNLVGGGHPSLLVEDTEAPQVDLTCVDDGEYVNGKVSIRVDVSDQYWGYLAATMPDAVVVRMTRDGDPWEEVPAEYENARPGDTFHSYDISLPARDTHEDDGRYVLEVKTRDLVGNVSRSIMRSFAIDTTAPTVSVTFDDHKTGNVAYGGSYYAEERVARIVLDERNLALGELEEDDPLVRVVPHAALGRTEADVKVGAWRRDESNGSFVCDVVFPVDGTYELAIEGRDKAGNVLVGSRGTEVDEAGRYASGMFVIDGCAPRVSIAYSSDVVEPSTYGGVAYFGKPVTALVEVTDRNLDVSHTTVVSSDGTVVVPTWTSSDPDEHGEVTHRASVLYFEESTGDGAGSKLPVVVATDLSRNRVEVSGEPFVVDQTAPYIDGVSVSKDPSAEGTDGTTPDPYWFFNERDGIAAAMTITVADEFPLDAVWVVDPDGAYEVRQESAHGSRSFTTTLRLRDYEEEGSLLDTDWERDVLLCVRDLAGNERVWSLDRTGSIVADRVTSDANASIDGLEIFPMALVKDVTAPRVSVAGVRTGSFYNEAQSARILVDEHNLSYLKRFEPAKSVAVVEGEAGNEGLAHLAWTIPVRSLEGSDPRYGYEQPFVADGHYTLQVHLEDIARNESETVSIGPFTIDTTAPIIEVRWDNDDVRNGMYYNAPRTATIVVTEHNFDEALFQVTTTGSVGRWTSMGDEHVCHVEFLTDAPAASPHTLSVRGADKAGNEAGAYEAAPFAIDTHAPTVSVLKRTSDDDRFVLGEEQTELLDESAFSEALMPLVVFEDDASLDARGLEVGITGKRTKRKASDGLWERRESSDENHVVVDWGNIGLSEGTDGPFYKIDADDVYTITARAVDLAGNASEERKVSFSVNRFGSNYYVEPLRAQSTSVSGKDPVMLEAPQIVVHEVNVSGAASEVGSSGDGESHMVTKEYANATTSIERSAPGVRSGYELVASTDADGVNSYEGWTEYVYTIHSGNFGSGSSSDYGDGGQGLYRVDVSMRDKANNHNTTARFWESVPSRTDEMHDKTATIAFMLDEFGPKIQDVDLPGPFVLGDSYQGSFRLVDEIGNGDYLTVMVDDIPVPVYREGSPVPLDASGRATQQGTYCFEIPARPLTVPRKVDIRVSDYTGRPDREKHVQKTGFHLTTLGPEAMLAAALMGLVMVVIAVVYRLYIAA